MSTEQRVHHRPHVELREARQIQIDAANPRTYDDPKAKQSSGAT